MTCKTTFGALLALTLTTACSGSSGEADAPAGLRVHRGHVILGHEVRAFRPCGSEESIWLTDESGLLAELHGELAPPGQPYGEMFAVVDARRERAPAEGFGADYPGALRVARVLYAGGEGPGCDYPWASFRFRALGNEPFWSVDVSDRGLRLSRPGEPGLEWSDASEERDDGTLRFTATGEHGSIALDISSEPGRDSMSGAWFGYTASLRLGDQTFTGTVLQGE